MKKTEKYLYLIIIVLLIGILGAGTIFIIKINRNNMKNKINFIDNFDEFDYPVGKYFSLDYAAYGVKNENGFYDEVDYYDEYNVTFQYNDAFEYKKGSLNIYDSKTGENHVVELNKVIRDCYAISKFDYYDESYMSNGYTEYISILYVLFEDGSLGKIDTNDIKNNNYSVTMLNKYVNIEYFQEVGPTMSGHGKLLYVVDKMGNAKYVDWITPGN